MKIDIFTDGGARGNPGPAAAGIVIKNDHEKSCYGYFLGTMTNNQAEYWALIFALGEIYQVHDYITSAITVHMDSELIVKQVKGAYRVKDGELIRLHGLVVGLLKDLPVIEFVHIPREKNTAADKIVNRVLDVQNGVKSINTTT